MPMRNYTPQQYIELVSKSNLPFLQNYMESEINFLTNICKDERKDLIDLGAGYGRILPSIITHVNFYYGIEINDAMFNELKKRTVKYTNSTAIKGDFTELRNILKNRNVKIGNTRFVLLQNTLGVIEGNLSDLLTELKYTLSGYSELIISIFKSEKLINYGLEMFTSLLSMVGEPDIEYCDFSKGLFRSKTGYEAKWWSEEEIRNIIKYLNVSIVSKVETEIYAIYQLKPKY